MIIYLQWYQPFDLKSATHIETFNEVTVITLTYFLFCFTDFVAQAETRNSLGMYYNGVIFANIAVHMLIMLRNTYQSLRLYCLKRSHARRMRQMAAKRYPVAKGEKTEAVLMLRPAGSDAVN